jgi:hypothetical protein
LHIKRDYSSPHPLLGTKIVSPEIVEIGLIFKL